jgi:UDP-N-acetylglucosamine 2-epimerase (non-hydrolysing)
MPEEINRILTDHASDLLFVTEESGLQNLRNEGASPDKVHFVGNTMIDSLLNFREKADASTILEKLTLVRHAEKNGGASSVIRYALLTLHRPSNVDNRDVFLNIIAGLEELATDCPIVFPVHPRTRRRIGEFGLAFGLNGSANTDKGIAQGSGNRRDGIILSDPLGYLDFLCLMKHATLVVTDSGGIQEETTILDIPCVTVRENTERPITVESGTNTIAGTKTDTIKDAIRRQLGRKRDDRVLKNWDGRAGARIIDILARRHYEKTSFPPAPPAYRAA